MKETEKLYIPYGIGIEKEYITGFGKREIKHFFIGIFFTAAAALITFLIFGQPVVPIIILLTGTGGSYMVTRKEMYSQSVVEIVQGLIRFKKNQQKFPYIY